MTFTKVEVLTPNLPKKVSIKTFFEEQVENMGLEKYGMVLHDGVSHTEQLACLENNGVKRYITGLNEFAPDIKMMDNQEEKEAKIREIRTIVAGLEAELAANQIDPADPDFWNKVELLRPNNSEFWDKIELTVSNDASFLDPKHNPYDLIKLCAIQAGGFSMISGSYDQARNMAKPPKFYLDKYEETITVKNESRKVRNKALSELQSMYDKNSNKLLYVTKVIDLGSPQFTKSTPNDVLYEAMDEYINGMSFEKNAQKAAEHFLKIARTKVGELKLNAMIKDAAYHKVIINKSDGYLYHADTQSMLGKNVSDIIEYLNNPVNDEILAKIQDFIEEQWNK